MNKSKLTNWFIIGTFTLLYLFVSIISMIHTVEFFQLSNPVEILAISLAVAFELGAAASLATVVTQDAMNKFIVWSLFIILTLFQMMGNTYYAYHNLAEYSDWSELFALNDLSVIEQKRYLAIISGAILPIVALGYIKCLVDYLKSKKGKRKEEEYEGENPMLMKNKDYSDDVKRTDLSYYTKEEKPKEDFKERYKKVTESDWFKNAYENMSDGTEHEEYEEKEEFPDEYLEETLAKDEKPIEDDLEQIQEDVAKFNTKSEINNEGEQINVDDSNNDFELNEEQFIDNSIKNKDNTQEVKKVKKKPQGFDISRKTFF